MFQPTALAAICRLAVLCGDYPTQATCESSEQTQPHLYDTLATDIQSGTVAYDGVKARTCIDSLNTISSCMGGLGSVEVQFSATCTGIFTGKVPAGGTCYFSDECAGGAACDHTATNGIGCYTFTQCCAGNCSATPSSIPLGGDCSSAANCAAGTICSTSLTPATCVAVPATVGASCATGQLCASPLYCSSTAMTCQELPLTGEPCAHSGSLASYGVISCQSPFDTCDATTDICVRMIAVGAVCDPTNDHCVRYAFCDPTTSACVTRPAVGQPCDPNSPACLGGSCDPTTSQCTLAPTAGSCT
jgi:hypothetical protein